MLNDRYPEFSGDPLAANDLETDYPPAPLLVQKNPSISHPVPINNPSANHLAPHHPPANHLVPNIMSRSENSMVSTASALPAKKAIMQCPLQDDSSSNRPTSKLPDNTPHSILLRPELVSQLVSALQTVNYPELATVGEDTANKGDKSNLPEETIFSTRRGPEESGKAECQNCKPIIDRLKQEIRELRGCQLPGTLGELCRSSLFVCYVLW